MNMSDAEILTSYNQAKHPAQQIGVLADLNGCDRATIRAKLQEQGAELPPEKAVKKKPPVPPTFDVDRALELHREGLSDLDISERLGVRPSTFAAWRRRQGLQVNRQHPVRKAGGKAPAPDASGASGSMTALRVAEVFSQIAKWYPDAPVLMDGKILSAIMLSSCFDSRKDA